MAALVFGEDRGFGARRIVLGQLGDRGEQPRAERVVQVLWAIPSPSAPSARRAARRVSPPGRPARSAGSAANSPHRPRRRLFLGSRVSPFVATPAMRHTADRGRSVQPGSCCGPSPRQGGISRSAPESSSKASSARRGVARVALILRGAARRAKVLPVPSCSTNEPDDQHDSHDGFGRSGRVPNALFRGTLASAFNRPIQFCLRRTVDSTHGKNDRR